MKNLVIIGAGGHGKVAADIALKMNKWERIEFLDDTYNLEATMGIEVTGRTESVVSKIKDSDIFVAIGKSEVREEKTKQLEELDASIATLIHPDAVIGTDVKIGNGTVIMARVVVNCSTEIGKGSIINTGATVDHDCRIGDYVHVCPGVNIAGGVEICYNTWIGIGSTVINNIRICSNCYLGAGAVATKDIDNAGTYIGCPARKIK